MQATASKIEGIALDHAVNLSSGDQDQPV